MTYRTAKIRSLEQSSVHACIVMKPCGGYVQGMCKFGRATPKRTIGHCAFHCALIRALLHAVPSFTRPNYPGKMRQSGSMFNLVLKLVLQLVLELVLRLV